MTSKSLILFVGLAHLPMATEYAMRMWRTGHYQFFPLVMLVIAWFWYQTNHSLASVAEKPSGRILVGSLLANLALIFVATLLRSSFVCSLSIAMLLANTFYACYGKSGLGKATPLLFLALFTIPLPVRLDSWLIFKLQFLASHLASWILDALQQSHFREGVILQTESRGFLTEEACSGVRSLFSSLAGIAVYGVTLAYPWWRHTFNLMQIVFWVVVGNAFRVAIVVFVTENYTEQIASGWPHEMLGLVMFVLIFLLAVSTDRLFGAFVNESTDDNLDPYGESIQMPTQSPTDSTSTQSSDFGFLSELRFATSGWVIAPIAVCILLLGARMAYVSSNLNQGVANYVHHRLPFPQEADMPASIGDWKLVSFKHTNRGKAKLQAEDSFIWTYEYNGVQALISVDCPWDAWHDLSYCYSGLGWTTRSDHFFDGDATSGEGTDPERFSQLSMHKQSGEVGMVIFSSVDANGNMVAPQYSSGHFSLEAVFNQLVANLTSVLGLGTDKRAGWMGYKLPLSTLQLYCTPETEIDEEKVKSLRRLFVDARKLLVESSRFKGE